MSKVPGKAVLPREELIEYFAREASRLQRKCDELQRQWHKAEWERDIAASTHAELSKKTVTP